METYASWGQPQCLEGHLAEWDRNHWTYVQAVFRCEDQRHIPALRFEKIRIRGDEVGRRDMLTDSPDGEYAQLTSIFEPTVLRRSVRIRGLLPTRGCARLHFDTCELVYVTGELNQLRWGDIKTLYPPAMDDAGLTDQDRFVVRHLRSGTHAQWLFEVVNTSNEPVNDGMESSSTTMILYSLTLMELPYYWPSVVSPLVQIDGALGSRRKTTKGTKVDNCRSMVCVTLRSRDDFKTTQYSMLHRWAVHRVCTSKNTMRTWVMKWNGCRIEKLHAQTQYLKHRLSRRPHRTRSEGLQSISISTALPIIRGVWKSLRGTERFNLLGLEDRIHDSSSLRRIWSNQLHIVVTSHWSLILSFLWRSSNAFPPKYWDGEEWLLLA